MALQFIWGNSGAGKSHYMMERVIKEAIASPQRSYLILVPEQFTLHTQQELTRLHPNQGMLNIDVQSFQRLAFRILEETGQEQRVRIDETGKSLILQRIAQREQKNLVYFGKRLRMPGYISEMKSLISELIQYQVEPEDLKRMIEREDLPEVFRFKLTDICRIYEGYLEYLSTRYLSGEELLKQAARLFGNSKKLKNTTLILDGFHGFTPLQFEVLRAALTVCPEVLVTVTLDSKEDALRKGSEHQLFAYSKKMIQKLLLLAREEKVTVMEPIFLKPGNVSRFADNPELHFLEQNLFRYRQGVFKGETSRIRMFEASTPAKELLYAAVQIRRLVREEGYRYGEIAVLSGDAAAYKDEAERIFSGMQIPYFLDEKNPVTDQPFVEYLHALFSVAEEHMSVFSVMRYLRSGFSGVTMEEADLLENYLIANGIKKETEYEQPFIRKTKDMTDEDLLEINRIREKLLLELGDWCKEIRKRNLTVRERATILYTFLVHAGTAKKLSEQKKWFEEKNEQTRRRQYEQIYMIILQMLDQAVQILGEEKIGFKDFVTLMDTGFAETKIGLIPPGNDQVLVGELERTRLKKIRVLFFVGVNDGIIPKKVGNGGLFSMKDRERLEEDGNLELAPSERESMYVQRFYLYQNLTKPEDRLFLSYARAGENREQQLPSYLITTVSRMFEQMKIEDADEALRKIEGIETPRGALSLLCEGFRELKIRKPEALWETLFGWYRSKEEYRGKVFRLLDAAFYRLPQEEIGKDVAELLYGSVSQKSATRLEKFSACAYAHFLQYGLSLSERQEFGFERKDMGSVMHKVLEVFQQKLEEDKEEFALLDDEKREAYLTRSMEEAVLEKQEVLSDNARSGYQMHRIERILSQTLFQLQKQQQNSSFQTEGTEVWLDRSRLDRLDIWKKENKVYVKVLDFKSGDKKLDLVALYYGLQMQLFLYLDSAMEMEEKKHRDCEILPAGVFYYHLDDPVVEAADHVSRSEIDKAKAKEMKMKGLMLADPDVVRGIDASLESLPARIKNDGSFYQDSSVAESADFALLRRFVQKKAEGIKQKIENGCILIDPYQRQEQNGCRYCPYQGVCHFDETLSVNGFRRLENIKEDEVWRRIREEGKEEQ